MMKTGTEFSMLTFQPLQNTQKGRYPKRKITMEKIGNFFKDECGAAMVEYGLLVALIAVVCIIAVTTLGSSLSAKFQAVSSSVSAAS
jgi:pilus assembly protein Flp/PilA